GADHLHVVRRALAPAGERPRLVLVAGVGAGEEAAVRADAVVEHDPLAAAVLALATRLLAQRQLLHVQPVPRLRHLGGAVEGMTVDAAEHRTVAVPECGASPPADLGLDDREVPARVRM